MKSMNITNLEKIKMFCKIPYSIILFLFCPTVKVVCEDLQQSCHVSKREQAFNGYGYPIEPPRLETDLLANTQKNNRLIDQNLDTNINY